MSWIHASSTVDHLKNAHYVLEKGAESLSRSKFGGLNGAERRLAAGMEHLERAAGADSLLSPDDLTAVSTAAYQTETVLTRLRDAIRSGSDPQLGGELLELSVNQVNNARHTAAVALAHLRGTDPPAPPAVVSISVPSEVAAQTPQATRIEAYNARVQSLSTYFREIAPKVGEDEWYAKDNLTQLCAALDRVPESTEIAPLLDNTKAVAYRTLLGMTRDLPGMSNGYKGFPEVANLGHLQSNLELLAIKLEDSVEQVAPETRHRIAPSTRNIKSN